MHPKHVPVRTCAGCGKKGAKLDLFRVVRTTSGGIELDPAAKKLGRGAYLCKRLSCWESGLRRGHIERTLRRSISEADSATMLDYAAILKE
jgi:predicted RNA-binding protein YlxR (DUF448 family)